MKRYNVTLYYHTNITVCVNADNKRDAVEQARQYTARNDNNSPDVLLGGLVEDNTPDVEEIK